ncbi:MAG: lamin tail domain-containing protein [Bacteroidales bacterium]|nr:lamin tail domain-containing protein [Bacteroidales bacterium]
MKKLLLTVIALAILVPAVIFAVKAISSPARPEGPCDVYAKGGAPCAAAHSTTRALYAKYKGPLYQVMRQSDNKKLDIGVVKPSAGDPGGYADAAAQDAFCANTYCWVTVIYDQSGNENHLIQAPRGGFSGGALGGSNNLSMADWAPVTLMGHKVYGLYIAPGMGMRWNDTKGTAVDDQAEGQYWVIAGHHYNGGCCFDYGNAETDSRDDGDGTMETTYYGNGRGWYYGSGSGPWVMTDQENNLVGCVNESPNDKFCRDLPSISWRFVTATADGEPHHWRSMGGDAQKGDLVIMYDGKRIQNDRSSYDPMRKQGAILLGNGGDNSVGSSGTFYEGAMTAAGTFPTEEVNQAIQANVVAAGYDVQRLGISPSEQRPASNALQTFAPGSTQNVTVTFVNTTGAPLSDLTLKVETPKGWKAVVSGSSDAVKAIDYTVEPGQTVIATFAVTSGSDEFNGDLQAEAAWMVDGKSATETAVEKVRNVSPVKINEFRISDARGNTTNTFIELFNAGDKEVDISGWTLTQHAINLPYFSAVTVPSGTKMAPKGFYLFGLSNSGLSVQAAKGDKIVYVRSVAGISAGDEIEIGTGKNAEKRVVANVITPAPQNGPQGGFGGPQGGFGGPQGGFGGAQQPRRLQPVNPTTVWQPLPEGPYITIPAGSTSIPVASVNGFAVGQKMAIGYGETGPFVSNVKEQYEVVTVTAVGKPGTQGYLSMDAKPGDTNIKVSSVANITAGDKIRLDINSVGHGVEWVTVKSVGTQSARNTLRGPLGPNEDPGTGLELEEPLKYAHSSNMPYSVNGTGISFEPATKFAHMSNEPVLPLAYALELTEPLANNHDIDDVVFDAKVTDAGYQGDVPANQLFGGPALPASRGNITLRNAKGLIVDALNFGSVVDPWLSEGYHGDANASGNFAPAPSAGGNNRGGFGAPQAAAPEVSTGRFPDGADSDDNAADFHVHRTQVTAAASASGAVNVKVGNVQRFQPGQVVYIGTGNSTEQAVIATVGTPGSTSLGESASAGSKVLRVLSAQNFSAGQVIEIGTGASVEQAVIASVEMARRGGRGGFPMMGQGAPGAPQQPQYDAITLENGLKRAQRAGTAVSGTGITFTSALRHAHLTGEAIGTGTPTPGAPNRY